MPGPIQEDVTITENKKVSSDYGILTFEAKQLGKGFKPGQFMQLEVPGRNDLVLRRPMSPLRISKAGKAQLIEMMYKVVGQGTRELAALAARDKLNVLGPLGRGFKRPTKGSLPFLVAGGTGLGPVFMLAEELGKAWPVCFFFGAKCADEVCYNEEMKELPAQVVLCTDDGSLGEKGFVTDSLKKRLGKEEGKKVELFACGPRPMLLAVQEMAAARKLPAQLSLEERMGCGMGACLACAVKSSEGGYRMVCKDGPVFGADEVVL